MKILLTLLCACFLNIIQAIAPEDVRDDGKELRIVELMPGYLSILAINPAIPDNFVAMQPDKDHPFSDAIFWGPKDVLEEYFKNPDSLSESIIRIKLSTNVGQTGPKEFNHGTKKMVAEFKKMYPKGFESKEFQWGMYPVLAIRTTVAGESLFMAWIGMNKPGDGWTLAANLESPRKKGRPNKKDLELWNNFLTKTEQLTDHDFFKAKGLDLQPGYTIVRFGDSKLKVTAEKREHDGMLQVVVQPMTSNVTFDYAEMDEGLMGAEWHFAEHLVKIHGVITETKGRAQNICNLTISVLSEIVKEFSVDKDEKRDGLFVYQKAGEKLPEE